jgi:membrane-associated phospholipid phosphatase
MSLKQLFFDKTAWNVKKLSLSYLLCLFLLLSWFFGPSKAVWDEIDIVFFKFVNQFIASSSFWQGFWALANHNIFDWFHDVVMLAFFIQYMVKKNEKQTSYKISEGVFFCLLGGFTIILINRYLCLDILHIQRHSPSLVCDFTIRLSEKVQWIKTKGQSFTSYPGDHGTTAIMFAMCIWHLMGKKAGKIASCYAVFWLMPRLVTGCHWFTDVIMGSLVIAILVSSFAIYTPFKNLACHSLNYIFQRKKQNTMIQP